MLTLYHPHVVSDLNRRAECHRMGTADDWSRAIEAGFIALTPRNRFSSPLAGRMPDAVHMCDIPDSIQLARGELNRAKKVAEAAHNILAYERAVEGIEAVRVEVSLEGRQALDTWPEGTEAERMEGTREGHRALDNWAEEEQSRLFDKHMTGVADIPELALWYRHTSLGYP